MDFKKVSEITAVAIPFLIVCSAVYLTTYYSHWNIPILEYLSTAEMLFLFMWPILMIAVFAGSYLLVSSLFIGIVTGIVLLKNRFAARKAEVQKPETKAEEKAGQESAANAKPEKKPSRIFTLFSYFVVIVAVVVLPIIYIRAIWVDYDVPGVIVGHAILWVAIWVGSHQVFVWMKREPGSSPLLIATMVVFLCASFFYGRYDAHYATTKPKSQTVVLVDGSTIETDANTIYLGKTSGFYFYYKAAEKEAMILPAAQIRSVTIKQPE